MIPARTLEPAAQPLVVKIGGRALEPAGLRELAVDLLQVAGDVVVVHGGGIEVSEWCARLSIEPRFHDGLRVTDPETLEVAVAVLGGLANKRLVASLRAAGVDAVGLSAVDGGIAELEPHPDSARLGAVGLVESVHPLLLHTLFSRGFRPVLSSVGAHQGSLLNINADDLAAAVAIALEAHTLVFLSDAPGLELDGARVPHLDLPGLERAIRHPDVRGGMVPKLKAAREALTHGVGRVHIVAWSAPGALVSLLAGADVGTTLSVPAPQGVPS